MVKNVKKGCRDCTIVLDGSECAVEFPANYRVFSAQNMSDSDIVMSVESGRTAEDDGVRIVEAGGCGMLAHMRSDINTVYITGTGKVHISAGNEAVLPFKAAGKGGESINVSGEGNPVTLDGLQGGVPFAEMVVSGKNLLTYPYANTTKTVNGITFTDNGDGTITANGTATANATFTFAKNFGFEKEGNYFLSGCPSGGGLDSFFINWYQNHTGVLLKNYNDYGSGIGIPYQHVFSEYNSLSIAIITGTVCDNLIFRPQIELSSTPTAYEPPITGRELTVNVNGTDYTITPDTNPYIIPNDIRQQDGLNVISVSAGELSVTGIRKNAAIKRIFDDMGMDLLFDGLAIGSSPAVGLDFSGYSKFVVSNYLNTSSSNCDFAGTVLIERDRLELLISSGWFLDVPISTSYSIRDYFSGTISDASFYAMQSMDASAQYFTRIYGIR